MADKRALPCWSPATPWANPASVGVLVLDVDGGTSIEEARARCASWATILHTTWSHAPEAPRFRVLLPLARPVPAAAWKARWAVAVEAIGLPVDRACCDARRRYLLPARPQKTGTVCGPESAEGASWLAVADLDRPALDLLAVEPPAPRQVRTPSRPVRVPWHQHQHVVCNRLRHDPGTRRRVAERLDAHLSGAGPGERASGAVCPKCARPSAWFFVAPDRATSARCNHLDSCGWSGPLWELLPGLLP